ncbi:hypothetical protein VPH35_098931 [Triticum aestivum]|uniref:dehydration-responsive element-binding protein 1B n=1 Tax=Triticum aestivum TaxID=4565 RepID=UPI001D012642|nr:dehydration-responsive element-binding protein 1B-like [Triticum aestivum]
MPALSTGAPRRTSRPGLIQPPLCQRSKSHFMSSSTKFDRSVDAASPSDDQEQGLHQTVSSDPPTRPAGRTKLKETLHPVYRSGLAGGWLCELRVHGTKGSRFWHGHGTFATAETAARALALSGCDACLNFADSACWMLPVLAAGSFGFSSAHVFKDAVATAVVAVQRKQPLVSPADMAD